MCELTQHFTWFDWLVIGTVWTWVAGSIGAAISKQDEWNDE